MTILWDEELAWRCLPRPLPELKEIEQRLIEILVARGAVLDGEAGGRVQLMWEDNPVYVGHDPEAPEWCVAEVTILAGLDLRDDPGVQAAVDAFAVHAPATVRFDITEAMGLEVWVDRPIATTETSTVQLMLAVDQLLATGIALQHQLAPYEDIDDS